MIDHEGTERVYAARVPYVCDWCFAKVCVLTRSARRPRLPRGWLIVGANRHACSDGCARLLAVRPGATARDESVASVNHDGAAAAEAT